MLVVQVGSVRDKYIDGEDYKYLVDAEGGYLRIYKTYRTFPFRKEFVRGYNKWNSLHVEKDT